MLAHPKGWFNLALPIEMQEMQVRTDHMMMRDIIMSSDCLKSTVVATRDRVSDFN